LITALISCLTILQYSPTKGVVKYNSYFYLTHDILQILPTTESFLTEYNNNVVVDEWIKIFEYAIDQALHDDQLQKGSTLASEYECKTYQQVTESHNLAIKS
jgi:hypothetical protein